VTESELCGVFVDLGSSVRLRDGEVRSSTIGACIQDPDFDLSELSTAVAYIDNETNLETTELPIPDALPTVPTS
jgi:hypothetical protein